MSKKSYRSFWPKKFFYLIALTLSDIWEGNYGRIGHWLHFFDLRLRATFVRCFEIECRFFASERTINILPTESQKVPNVSIWFTVGAIFAKKWTQFIAISSPAESWKWRPNCCWSRSFCSRLRNRLTSLPPFPKIRGAPGKERRPTPISWTDTIWYNIYFLKKINFEFLSYQ